MKYEGSQRAGGTSVKPTKLLIFGMFHLHNLAQYEVTAFDAVMLCNVVLYN